MIFGVENRKMLRINRGHFGWRMEMEIMTVMGPLWPWDHPIPDLPVAVCGGPPKRHRCMQWRYMQTWQTIFRDGYKTILSRKGTENKTSKHSPKNAPYSPPILESSVKTRKVELFSNHQRVKRHEIEGKNTRLPGIKAAKSSFGGLRNPSCVEKEREKTSKKSPQNCPI